MDEIITEEMGNLDEVSEIIGKLKPQLKLTRHHECGNGYVRNSYFSFSHSGCYYWIVILCTGNFAFKRITPQWVEIYSNLILQSSEVYVEYNPRHYIINWSVGQFKFCGDTDQTGTKMVRAV